MAVYLPGETLMRIGGEISSARKVRNFTQASLAEKAGISRQTVSRVEQGNTRVALDTYIMLASLLGSVESLVIETPAQPDLAQAHNWEELS